MITLSAIYWPRRDATSPKVRKALDLRSAGATAAETSRLIGIPATTVRRWFKEHGTAPNAPDIGPVPVARRTVRQ